MNWQRLIKTGLVLIALGMAATELDVPDGARFIGWALILAAYVAHDGK